MNTGYGWRELVPGSRITRVIKRRIPEPGDIAGLGLECQFCGRVFERKHIRWVGDGWSCRDRCERERRGLP